MIAALLALLAAVPCPHPHRSRAVAARFRRLHPCPAGPDKGSTKRCRFHVIDHVVPLECCGPDAVSNMQWQSAADAKKKDRTERLCGGKAKP